LWRDLFREIKNRIHQAQYQDLRAVNRELVSLDWDIGSKLYEKIENSGKGQGVIKKLAQDLRAVFPGKRGFSSRNLWEMKKLYATYKTRLIDTGLLKSKLHSLPAPRL